MSLYHIHLRGASDGVNDPEGEEFANDAAARDHVIAAVREMMDGGLSGTADCAALVFEVRDRDGQLVATVPFSQAPRVPGGWRGQLPPVQPSPFLGY